MASLNKWMGIGNLTRDPEVRYTTKGTAVAELGIAINRKYKADNGEKREETTFVDVTLWGRTAELAGEYLKKGSSVYIEGRLHLESWDDKQTGQKRSKLKVVGEEMQFLGGREQREKQGEESRQPREYPSQRYGSSSTPSRASRPPADPDLDVDGDGDDIPFD